MVAVPATSAVFVDNLAIVGAPAEPATVVIAPDAVIAPMANVWLVAVIAHDAVIAPIVSVLLVAVMLHSDQRIMLQFIYRQCILWIGGAAF